MRHFNYLCALKMLLKDPQLDKVSSNLNCREGVSFTLFKANITYFLVDKNNWVIIQLSKNYG